MAQTSRIRILGSVIVACCLALVVFRAAGASSLPASAVHAPPEPERREFAEKVARDEPRWSRDAEKGFPSDVWSQRDAFHGSESERVRQIARDHHVRYEDVLRAVDDDLHRRRDDARKTAAVRCKPRPFYD